MKFKVKLTALVLVIIMVICVCPTNIIAQTDTEIQTDTSATPQDEGIASEEYEYSTEVIEHIEDEIIGNVVEAVEMREENVKHFRLSNGTYEAVIYPKAVHRNVNGEWKDIDNNLSVQSIKNVELYSTSDNRVSFASRFAFDSQIFTLSENGYTISMGLMSDQSPEIGIITPIMPPIDVAATGNTDAFTPTVINASVRPSSFDDLNAAKQINNKSSLKYSNVQGNVDLEYVLEGNDIKENIIIKSVSNNYEYQFSLNTDGLYAVLKNDGTVGLLDGETHIERYTIPAPFMYDASGVMSYDVSYTLSGNAQDGYILSVIADAEWINSSDRAFPVVIDPTIVYTEYYDITYISSLQPTINFADADYMLVDHTKTTLIKISPYGIPENATINSAYLNINYYLTKTSGTVAAGAYQILEDWQSDTATYASVYPLTDFLSSEPLSQATFTASSNYTYLNPGTISFSIKPALESWIENDYENNYGIAIKYVSGMTSPVYIMAYSNNNLDEYAYMTVNYTYHVPDGVYGFKMANVTSSQPIWIKGRDGAGYNVQQEMLSTSPVESFTRANLFKISRITDTNRYVIRSMYNNKLSFNYTADGGIVMKEIPVNDAEVPENDCFVIEYAFNGFKIRPYNSDKYITGDALIYDGILQSVEPDLYASTGGSTWEFVQYTGAHKQGSIIYYSSGWRSVGFIVGDTSSISTKTYSTRINYNTPFIEVDSTCLSLVTDNNPTAAMHSLSLTAANPGSLKFNFKISNSTAGSQATITTGYAYYNIVPKAGNYFIQSVGNKKYIDIEGNSTSSGADLQQYAFTGGTTLRWTIEHVPNSNGYVRIKSVHSGMYMGVVSSETTIIRQYNTQDDYTLWRVQYCSSGNLRLICKATESTGYVLAAPTSTANSADLTQILYTNDDNYRDEWTMYEYIYTHTIHHYYDQGYNIRFSDDTSTALDKIKNYHSIMAERYLRVFKVAISAQYISYTSAADTCKIMRDGSVTTENISVFTACDHGVAHMDRSSQFSGLASSNVQTAAVWSGHIYMPGYAVSISVGNRLIITPYHTTRSTNGIYNNKSAAQVKGYSLYSITHEMMHQLGMSGHHEGIATGRECIMTFLRSDIEDLVDGDVFCPECIRNVQNHLNDHHRI